MLTARIEEPAPVVRTDAETHRDLMARLARDRDREAFRQLFDHFAPRIKGLMMRSGASDALAEDVMQEAMMTVWRKVHLFAPERGSVSAWIFAIARNARINHLRKASSRPYEDVAELEMPSDEPGGEEITYSRQRARSVAAAIAALPAAQREIIEMAFVEDMTQVEIAEALDLPLGTVKSRMRLAYGKLKGQLEFV